MTEECRAQETQGKQVKSALWGLLALPPDSQREPGSHTAAVYLTECWCWVWDWEGPEGDLKEGKTQPPLHGASSVGASRTGAAHSLPFVLIFSTKQSYGHDLNTSPEGQGLWEGDGVAEMRPLERVACRWTCGPPCDCGRMAFSLGLIDILMH